MQITNESQAKWLIRKNESDDFKLTAKVIREEHKETDDKKPYDILYLSDAEGDYKVSSWALLTEKGVTLSTEVGMTVQIYAKKGNQGKFFIKNIEEALQ